MPRDRRVHIGSGQTMSQSRYDALHPHPDSQSDSASCVTAFTSVGDARVYTADGLPNWPPGQRFPVECPDGVWISPGTFLLHGPDKWDAQSKGGLPDGTPTDSTIRPHRRQKWKESCTAKRQSELSAAGISRPGWSDSSAYGTSVGGRSVDTERRTKGNYSYRPAPIEAHDTASNGTSAPSGRQSSDGQSMSSTINQSAYSGGTTGFSSTGSSLGAGQMQTSLNSAPGSYGDRQSPSNTGLSASINDTAFSPEQMLAYRAMADRMPATQLSESDRAASFAQTVNSFASANTGNMHGASCAGTSGNGSRMSDSTAAPSMVSVGA